MPAPVTILVPVNQLEPGDTKIPVAVEYAKIMSGRVVLLQVLPNRALDPDAVLPTEACARVHLDTLATQVGSAGVEAATVVRRGPIADAIVDEAASIGAKLIILGASTHSKRVVLHTSITDRVAHAASCPVLLVQSARRAHNDAARGLRSFRDDAARAGALTRRYLGTRTIEIARIIGSVDRAGELAVDFRRRGVRRPGSLDEQRFQRVLTATRRGETLPPITVQQLGFGYYVEDGHHRVAAALMTGQTEIDADVTEFVPTSSRLALALFAARTEFEHRTGLIELGATRAESYQVLLRAIEQFARDERISELPLAARRWEMNVYRPLWHAIRTRELAAAFPGDRTADVVARLAELREQTGVDWYDALEALSATHRHARGSTEPQAPASVSRATRARLRPPHAGWALSALEPKR
jgi:nucleotide-binding universal stress UspA family protein